MWWNIWVNQILSWSRDRNIEYLSIYCSCWNTLNSILRTHYIWDIWSWNTNIILKIQLKALLYLISIIKKMHIEQTYLRALSLELRKLEWIWYIFCGRPILSELLCSFSIYWASSPFASKVRVWASNFFCLYCLFILSSL